MDVEKKPQKKHKPLPLFLQSVKLNKGFTVG